MTGVHVKRGRFGHKDSKTKQTHSEKGHMIVGADKRMIEIQSQECPLGQRHAVLFEHSLKDSNLDSTSLWDFWSPGQ